MFKVTKLNCSPLNSKTLLLSLWLVCIPVYAQIWEFQAQSNSGTEYYIDKLSLRLDGRLISFSQLSNYSDGLKFNNILIKSMVQSRVTDCVQNRIKTIGSMGYSDFDGKGEILLISSKLDSDWISINMNKITGIIQSQVCRESTSG